MINPFKQESKIDIVTNGTVHTNTTFLVKSTDLNNTSLVNESISISIIDNKSNPAINEKVKTNERGEASIELKNVSEGNYTVNVTFEGDNEFKKCSVEQNLKIVDDAVEVLSHDNTTNNVDSGAFYSQQAGRIIYTGEVQLAPDGHYWKHMGNNEWVKID